MIKPSFYSYKYPFLNMDIDWRTKQEFYLDELNMTYGVAMGNLKKNWAKYKISKREGNILFMQEAASAIQDIQRGLGFAVEEFPSLGPEFMHKLGDHSRYITEYRRKWYD